MPTYIWCSRVTTQGEVLDPNGVPVGGGSYWLDWLRPSPSTARTTSSHGHRAMTGRYTHACVVHAAIVDTHDIVVSHWEGYYCDDMRPSATYDGRELRGHLVDRQLRRDRILEINGAVVNGPVRYRYIPSFRRWVTSMMARPSAAGAGRSCACRLLRQSETPTAAAAIRSRASGAVSYLQRPAWLRRPQSPKAARRSPSAPTRLDAPCVSSLAAAPRGPARP